MVRNIMVPQIFLVLVYQEILWPCQDVCLPALGALWEPVLSKEAQCRHEGYRTWRSRDATRSPTDEASSLNDSSSITF